MNRDNKVKLIGISDTYMFSKVLGFFSTMRWGEGRFCRLVARCLVKYSRLPDNVQIFPNYYRLIYIICL